MNKNVTIAVLVLLMTGCGKSGGGPEVSAEQAEETHLLGVELVSQVVELSTALPEDDDCQLRFATDKEIGILKRIRKLPVEERLNVLRNAIAQMSAGELDQLPIEYVSHAVVGADTEVRSKVIQEVLIEQVDAIETDSRLASICARVALDLDAVDQVPALLLPAVKVVSKKMAYRKSHRNLEVWVSKFDELIEFAPKSEYPIILEALLGAYSESFDSLVRSAEANPSDKGIQFRSALANLNIVSRFVGQMEHKLSDEQFVASKSIIEKLWSMPGLGISERVRRMAPSETLLGRRRVYKELLGIDNGLSLASMEDLVTTIKPDSFKLTQLNQYPVPDEELSLEIRTELAEIVVKKLKDEKNFPGSLDRIGKILKKVDGLISQEDATELFNKLLPKSRRAGGRITFYHTELMVPICRSLRGDSAMMAIEKVMEINGEYQAENIDLVLSSLFLNLEPEDAKKFLKRIQDMDLLLSKISLLGCLPPDESHGAFVELFEEARAIKDPVERMKAMSQIGAFEGHSQLVAQEFFEAYLKELVEIGDNASNDSQQLHLPISIDSAFRDRVGPLQFVNGAMGYGEKIKDWTPSIFTDQILEVIARDAELLTSDQAASLVETWSKTIDRTHELFSQFVGGRPSSERAFFVSRVVIPRVMSDDLERRRRSGLAGGEPSIFDSVNKLESDHVKGVYLAALKRSSELSKLDYGDDYLLVKLARHVPESDEQEAINATIEMLNQNKEESFLLAYTSCLSKLETTLDEKMEVFSVWEESFDSGRIRQSSLLRLAELFEGIEEPEASEINAKILDWYPRKVELLARIKPIQDGKDIVMILDSLDRGDPSKTEEAALKRIFGTMPSGSSSAQLRISRELIAGPNPSVYSGVKSIEMSARFVHPDDAKKWYELTFYVLENCKTSDRFRLCAEPLHLLGKKLTLEDSVNYFDRLLELKENFAVKQSFYRKENYKSVEHAITPLLVNIANQDYSEFEKRFALVEEIVSPEFEQKIDEGLLAISTDEQSFTEIADRYLKKANDQSRQGASTKVLMATVNKPLLQSVKLTRRYGAPLENQRMAYYINVGTGIANRPTPKEQREACDLPESVGLTRRIIRQRALTRPAAFWE